MREAGENSHTDELTTREVSSEDGGMSPSIVSEVDEVTRCL